jgi:hypothetical protein
MSKYASSPARRILKLNKFPFTPEGPENNFNILMYGIDHYLISASTAPIIVKLRSQLSGKASF